MHIRSVQRLAGTSKRLARPLRFISSCIHGVMKRLETCTSSRLYGHPGSPDNGRSDFSAEENAERADCVRGEHADDGEGHWEFPVQSVSQNWEEGKHVRSPEKHSKNIRSTVHTVYLCHAEGCTSQSLHSVGRGRGGEFSWAGTRRGQDALTKQAEY